MRRLTWLFLNLVLPLAECVGVGYYFWRILTSPELSNFSFPLRLQWILPAGLLYLGAHTIWASFWVTLLHSVGVDVPWSVGVRSYFVSQLGKYVPGKVWVIVIRVRMLGGAGRDRAAIGVTATYEALISMASGAFVSLLLLPLVGLNLDAYGSSAYILIAVAAGIPLGAALLHRIIGRVIQKKLKSDSMRFPVLRITLMIRGLFQASLGWLLLGLSLWMVFQGVRPEPGKLDFQVFGRMTVINGCAYVLGFLAFFAPAGAGIRELVYQSFLAKELEHTLLPKVAGGVAAVASLILRLVWTFAELVMIAILHMTVPAMKEASLPPDEEKKAA